MNIAGQDITDPTAVAAHEKGVLAQVDLLRSIEMIRSNASRVMFYSLLYTTARESWEMRAAREGIDRALPGLKLSVKLLSEDGPLDNYDPDALAWVRRFTREREGDRAVFRGFGSRLLVLARPEDFTEEEARRKYFEFVAFAVEHFNAHFAGLINALSDDLIAARNARVKRANTARELAEAAMQRIRRVSRNVRMVSLNASVEAARAGNVGQGFAVIAEEIRRLSEDIGGASGDVHDGLKRIMRETGQ